MSRRGLFVVLEGMDRAGKSTQCQRLVEKLNATGNPASLLRFPERDTPIGNLIGQYLEKKLELDDHAIHLLFSANRWELKARIVDAVASGVHVVCDRYAYSGVAFTSAKVNGPDLAWCCQPEIGLPAPDLKIFLSVSPDCQRSRGGFGDERYEVADFQRRVGLAYDRLVDSSWLRVNADASVDKIQEELLSAVECAIKEPRDSELAALTFPGVFQKRPLQEVVVNTKPGSEV